MHQRQIDWGLGEGCKFDHASCTESGEAEAIRRMSVSIVNDGGKLGKWTLNPEVDMGTD